MLHIILPYIALIAAAVIIRYLAIDPGFGIKTRAAGELSMYFALGPYDVIYGDIDRLSLINDAFTNGATVGHDRFNAIMRGVLRQMRRADIALVYGGDELRMLVAPRSGLGACHRFQWLLQEAQLTADERARLEKATGRPYISITLAYEQSRGVSTHRAALNAAKARVQGAKPKGAAGRRGEVIA